MSARIPGPEPAIRVGLCEADSVLLLIHDSPSIIKRLDYLQQPAFLLRCSHVATLNFSGPREDLPGGPFASQPFPDSTNDRAMGRESLFALHRAQKFVCSGVGAILLVLVVALTLWLSAPNPGNAGPLRLPLLRPSRMRDDSRSHDTTNNTLGVINVVRRPNAVL